jgi:hypothetical protein
VAPGVRFSTFAIFVTGSLRAIDFNTLMSPFVHARRTAFFLGSSHLCSRGAACYHVELTSQHAVAAAPARWRCPRIGCIENVDDGKIWGQRRVSFIARSIFWGGAASILRRHEASRAVAEAVSSPERTTPPSPFARAEAVGHCVLFNATARKHA